MIVIEKAKRQGQVVFYHNTPLSSRYDPLAEAGRLVSTLPPQAKAAICLGLGPLYHLRELSTTLEKVILIEPRFTLGENLAELIKHFPFLKSLSSNCSQRFVLLDKANRSSLEQAVLHIPASIRIADIHIFDQLKKEEESALSLRRELVACLDAREKHLNTENYFEKIWIKNTLANLEKGPIHLVGNLQTHSQQGILIGSAPSLESQIETLRNKKVFKCALPGVLNYLLDNGIVPDCLLSSDASFYNTYHFQALKPKGLSLPLIVPLSISRHCLKGHGGKVYYFIDDRQTLQGMHKHLSAEGILNRLKRSIVGMHGSVTVSGLFVFSLLGIKQVAVVGADFSSTPFKSHARSNTTEEIMFSTTSRLQPFEHRHHYLYSYSLKKGEGDKWSDKKLTLYKELFERALDDLGVVLSPVGDLKSVAGPVLSERETESLHLPQLLKGNWQVYKTELLARADA